ncbi:MAG: hypothetical protein LPK00_03615 [Bacillaceae bacterium]|mgnify:CR=1 FL=1|nr:hypothetical protein [Bacillaceae bacterium]
MQRKIVSQKLIKWKPVTDPQWHAGTGKFAYVETEINEKENYISNIFVGKLDEQSIPYTYDKNLNHSPRWSPCGEKLAFVSDKNGKSQIYIMDENSGVAEQLTSCSNGVTNPVWSPCGTKLLFSLPVATGSKNEHLAIIDIKTKEITSLKEGDQNYFNPAISPDGKYVAYVTNKEDGANTAIVKDVFIMNVETKESRKVTKSDGFFSAISWSPDGEKLGFIGHQKVFDTLSRVWVYDIHSEYLQCLSEGLDIEVGIGADGVNPGLMWTADSEGFYFLVSDQGNNGIYYGSLDGAMYPIVLEEEMIYGITMNTSTHQAIVAISTPVNPGELFHLNLANQTRTQLTNVNKKLL